MPVTITITVDDPPPPSCGFILARFEVGRRGRYTTFPAAALNLAAERWSDFGMAAVHLYAVYRTPVSHIEYLREWSGLAWPHRRARQ